MIPIHTHAMVSSDTPACKKPPAKFVRLISVACFKKPSVLSELHKSADDTIILGTYCDNRAKQLADPLRVGELGFCSIVSQGICGNLPAIQSSSKAALSAFASAQAFSSALRSATILRKSCLRSSYI